MKLLSILSVSQQVFLIYFPVSIQYSQLPTTSDCTGWEFTGCFTPDLSLPTRDLFRIFSGWSPCNGQKRFILEVNTQKHTCLLKLSLWLYIWSFQWLSTRLSVWPSLSLSSSLSSSSHLPVQTTFLVHNCIFLTV